MSPDGYAWWYLDALSDDGRYGMTVIVFLGSVFSPHYARARANGSGVDPLEHAAVHVALSGGNDGSAWVFTERGKNSVSRSPGALSVGPSRVAWDGESLVYHLDEPTLGPPPLATQGPQLVGRIEVAPERTFDAAQVLDLDGRHRWWPVAPRCRIHVDLEHPRVSFRGSAYHDANWGDEPLELGFRYWNWSRAQADDGTAILYDVETRQGARKELGLFLRRSGEVDLLDAPRSVDLGRTIWGIPRRTRVQDGGRVRVARSLVSAPFYARAVLSSAAGGRETSAIHEVVDLDRFTAGWVQWMLRYRVLRLA